MLTSTDDQLIKFIWAAALGCYLHLIPKGAVKSDLILRTTWKLFKIYTCLKNQMQVYFTLHDTKTLFFSLMCIWVCLYVLSPTFSRMKLKQMSCFGWRAAGRGLRLCCSSSLSGMNWAKLRGGRQAGTENLSGLALHRTEGREDIEAGCQQSEAPWGGASNVSTLSLLQRIR